MNYRNPSTQTLFGGLVVLVGVLLLASTTGVYRTDDLLRFAPSLFVLLGLYSLVASGFRNVGGPLVVVVLAGAWQLVALDVVTAERALSFWPLLIVVFGASIMLGRVRPAAVSTDAGRVDVVSAFGGRDQRVTSDEFVGGDVTAVFGGGEIDLRDARVPTPPAHLSTTVLFGGVDVVVPREWNVRVDVFPLFGAAEDDRPREADTHRDVDLVVSGLCLFGGVTIKN